MARFSWPEIERSEDVVTDMKARKGHGDKRKELPDTLRVEENKSTKSNFWCFWGLKFTV